MLCHNSGHREKNASFNQAFNCCVILNGSWKDRILGPGKIELGSGKIEFCVVNFFVGEFWNPRTYNLME